MQIRSLGYRTDLIFARFSGQVADAGDCLVIRTPSNPAHWWGNFLIFPDPPGEDSLPAWTRRFHQEIASKQPAEHLTFGWDSPRGERGQVEPFLEAGFILNENVVLTAERVGPPPHPNGEVWIRTLETDAEWEQALENQVEIGAAEFPEAEYRLFRARRMEEYRRMARAGLGAWLGAFVEGRLVADLGVFVDGPVARFQAVETHPDFRRRGICGTLVHAGARHALSVLAAERLVMVADEHYHAARIYESLGFRPTERQLGLELRPTQ